ncbi:MAG: helix-turn-helix domain-containing protein [Halopseudomonas aestusnigri]|nr:helix-turn-helix domain-containing protein [Halopseudomonas aestusnigri]
MLHSVFAAALFTPASLDNLTVSHHYTQAWQALKRWPHGFHLLLSQYIDNPMSERGQSGINKHFRDIHEKLYRQRENKGIARLRAAFDQFIEINWPNAIQTHRLTRISLSSDERPLITQKEAQRLLDCREPRIHSLIAQGKITLHKFKGKAYFNREEIESLARLYQDNWSMEQAVIETELSRYQLKQLLDAGLVKALQRADSQNRDWLICKRSWQRMIRNFKKFATDDAKPKGKSLSGIQKQGFTISETLNLILNHKVTYRFTPEPSKPYSLKQLSDFRSKKNQLTGN